MFVEAHARLDGERFDADRDQVIACAHDAGVQTIVAVGRGGSLTRLPGSKIRAYVLR